VTPCRLRETRWHGPGAVMSRGDRPARRCSKSRHPARCPSLVMAPQSGQTRFAKQTGSPPSSHCPASRRRARQRSVRRANSLSTRAVATANGLINARKRLMSAGTPACAPDLDRIAGRQPKRTRCRVRGPIGTTPRRKRARRRCPRSQLTGWPAHRGRRRLALSLRAGERSPPAAPSAPGSCRTRPSGSHPANGSRS
jgi:hypothetical protein